MVSSQSVEPIGGVMQGWSRISAVRSLVLLVATGLIALSSTRPLAAQDAQTSSSAVAAAQSTERDRRGFNYEVYSGFSYFRPFHSSLTTSFPDGTTITADYGSAHTGDVTSLSYFFSRYVGVQIEAGLNPDGYNDGFWAAQGGLVAHKPSHGFQPFFHVLGGETEVAGPNAIPKDRPYYHVWTWEPSVTVGGGIDRELPFYNHHFSVRLVQADYSFFRVNFGTQNNGTGGYAAINAVRLSSGLVFHPGWTAAPPVRESYTCAVTPASVYPGDPVTVAFIVSGLNPKKPSTYSWSGQGLIFKGDAGTASIDTASLTAGTYPIIGRVAQGTGKHATSAECMASLTVKAFEPPTVSCSANPASVESGGSSTITAAGVSPQNRPLTYSYSTSAGQVSGSGTTATLSTAGTRGGPITVTCKVVDDKGQTASASTAVTVAPVVPPALHTRPLCSINFDRDLKRPARVNNEAKACLDSVALAIKSEADATLVIVGKSTQAERGGGGSEAANLAAQRAANTKAYLTTEKGIDEARISVRTEGGDSKAVENYLVPAGATFDADVPGTTPVAASTVKAEPWKPLLSAKGGPSVARHHKKRSGSGRGSK